MDQFDNDSNREILSIIHTLFPKDLQSQISEEVYKWITKENPNYKNLPMRYLIEASAFEFSYIFKDLFHPDAKGLDEIFLKFLRFYFSQILSGRAGNEALNMIVDDLETIFYTDQWDEFIKEKPLYPLFKELRDDQELRDNFNELMNNSKEILPDLDKFHRLYFKIIEFRASEEEYYSFMLYLEKNRDFLVHTPFETEKKLQKKQPLIDEDSDFDSDEESILKKRKFKKLSFVDHNFGTKQAQSFRSYFNSFN